MAEIKKYLHTLDIGNNKIINLLLNPLTTFQRGVVGGSLTTADEGYVCYDTDENVLYFWDTVINDWVASGGGGTTPNLQQVTDVDNNTTNPIWLKGNGTLSKGLWIGENPNDSNNPSIKIISDSDSAYFLFGRQNVQKQFVIQDSNQSDLFIFDSLVPNLGVVDGNIYSAIRISSNNVGFYTGIFVNETNKTSFLSLNNQYCSASKLKADYFTTNRIQYLPNANGTLALSVNGVSAGTDGSITIPVGSTVTPAALTKTDDTNVTLTLGGTPSTALLQATSMTLGWSGQLSIGRGGTGLSTLGTANQLIRVNSGATALEYFTPTYLTSIPIATSSILGGVKIGSGVSVAGDGTISVSTNYQAPLSGSGVVKSTAGTISYISGTSSQFIKGDGSLDSSTYLTSAVTSVGATGPITSSGGNTPTISTSMATNKLIGRSSSGVGVMEEISIGTGLSLSSGILTNTISLSGYVPYSSYGTNNVSANNFFDGFTSIAASGTLITLTVSSTPSYLVTGSGGQTIKLPNATTLPNGSVFDFNNNQSSGAISVNNNSNTLVKSIPSGGYLVLTLIDNSTSAGSWDAHFQAPSNVSWSTNTFTYGGSFTGGTWNGNAVGILYGGTGASTAAAARTNLGSTTVGDNLFTLANPSAITFIQINSDNTVSTLSASSFRTAIGAGTGSGDMILASTQTNSGAKTFLATTLLLRNVANTFNGSFTNTNTADRIYTLPNLDTTIAGLAVTQTFTGVNTFNPSVTASSNLAIGTNYTPTLTTSTSSDILTGISCTTTFKGGLSTGAGGYGIISNGGTGYTNGSYTGVAMTGGTGSGALASITVAGGIVTVCTITTAGSGYTMGDVLSTSGVGAGSGFQYTAGIGTTPYAGTFNGGLLVRGAGNTALSTFGVAAYNAFVIQDGGGTNVFTVNTLGLTSIGKAYTATANTNQYLFSITPTITNNNPIGNNSNANIASFSPTFSTTSGAWVYNPTFGPNNGAVVKISPTFNNNSVTTYNSYCLLEISPSIATQAGLVTYNSIYSAPDFSGVSINANSPMAGYQFSPNGRNTLANFGNGGFRGFYYAPTGLLATSTANFIAFENTYGNCLFNTTSGKAGFGLATQTLPGSRIQIAAGITTANTAPLQFTLTGSALESVARAGVMETSTTNFYLTNGSLNRFALGGTIKDFITDVATTTATTETDIYTYTTVANTLNTNGDKIDAKYGLQITATGGITKQIRVYFGGTLIFDTGVLTIGASTDFLIDVLVIRDSSTSVRCIVRANDTGYSTPSFVKITKVTGLTLSATNILKVTGTVGTGAVAGDITGILGTIQVKGAA